jgi:hypothetical protein
MPPCSSRCQKWQSENISSRTIWWLEILRNNQKEVIRIEKASAEMKYLEFNNQHGFVSWANFAQLANPHKGQISTWAFLLFLANV